MAEHVVEHVRLLEIVELRCGADEVAGREATLGEVIEEDVVRDQAGHRHHRPAGAGEQALVQLVELRNAGRDKRSTSRPSWKARPRGPGAAAAGGRTEIPDAVILGREPLPMLRDRPVRRRARRRGGSGGFGALGDEFFDQHGGLLKRKPRPECRTGWMKRALF
jgi:hypothetical protein